MAAKQPREQGRDTERQDGDRRDALVAARVLHLLGKPAGLHRIHVRRLWDDHYRVNILIGEDAASARVANSYFLEVDGDGSIVASTPRITKQY